ncbi:hypothetical protein ACI2L4_09970 [Streptomyces sparsogenes]|uniref:hypothetical protein n=1 Tax=Streptomyces sparsogenes TaxID=67365 RepID=UPI0038502603
MFSDPTKMNPYLVDGKTYPDPFTDPVRYLLARKADWRDAHRELAEAYLFAAADLLRGAWPTAHRVIFDCTEKDRRRFSSLEFQRVEDCEGKSLATVTDLPADEKSDTYGVVLAVQYLLASVREFNVAGPRAGEHRLWSIKATDTLPRDTRLYFCVIILPPATRPEGDRTALMPNTVNLRDAKVHVFDREPDAGAPSDAYVIHAFDVSVAIREGSAPIGSTEPPPLHVNIYNEGRAKGVLSLSVEDDETTHRI